MEKKSLADLSELELKQLYSASYMKLEQSRLNISRVIKSLEAKPTKDEYQALRSKVVALKREHKQLVTKHQAVCSEIRQVIRNAQINDWRRECRQAMGIPIITVRHLAQWPLPIPALA
jgi:hypothetical protein